MLVPVASLASQTDVVAKQLQPGAASNVAAVQPPPTAAPDASAEQLQPDAASNVAAVQPAPTAASNASAEQLQPTTAPNVASASVAVLGASPAEIDLSEWRSTTTLSGYIGVARSTWKGSYRFRARMQIAGKSLEFAEGVSVICCQIC